MEVRHAMLVGAAVSALLPLTAFTAGADPSSTAAFPVAPAANDGEPNPSSRAGFPLSPSSPAQSASSPRAALPQQFAGSSYPVQPQPLPQGYPYGYAAPPYAPVGHGPYSSGGGDAPAEEKKTKHDSETPSSVSLTISAVRLIFPVFEPTLEARLTDHIGAAVFGGLGEATPKILGQSLVDTSDRFSVREVGGQFLGYPIGRFDGLVLGGEVMYTKVSGTVSSESLDVSGSAVAIGPLVGGKWIHSSGFTLFAHVGVQRVWLKADSTAYGQTVTQTDAIWFPLLNVNVGWSF